MRNQRFALAANFGMRLKTPRRVGICRGPDRPLPDCSHFVIGSLCDANHITRAREGGEPAGCEVAQAGTAAQRVSACGATGHARQRGGAAPTLVLLLGVGGAAVRSSRCGCATSTSCAAASRVHRNEVRVRGKFIVGSLKLEQEPHRGGCLRHDRVGRDRHRQMPRAPAVDRTARRLPSGSTGAVTAASADPRVPRTLRNGGLAGHLGGREPQGGAADARARQRGHDAGRVRRFVRV